METLMAVAARIEILMASVAVGLLITTIALRGMFRAVGAIGAPKVWNGRPVEARRIALKAGTNNRQLALARVRSGHN